MMTKSLQINFILAALLSLLSFSNANGQREQNNIFVFDCTGSMRNNHLWSPAKDALDATILNQSKLPGVNFKVIPFGDHAYGILEFDAENYPKRKTELDKTFNEYINKAKHTNISHALKTAFDKVDTNKENNIYLLTDGEPEGPDDSSEKVYQTIKAWCANHTNSRLFYVALTKGAVNATIQKAIDECEDAYIVQCEGDVIPQIVYVSPKDIYTNIEEFSRGATIKFSVLGTYGIKNITSDPLFEVNVKGNQAQNGKIDLIISSEKSPDELRKLIHDNDYEFEIELQSTDPVYKIGNPKVRIHVSDEIPSKLTLAEGKEQLAAEGVKWHDTFLWCSAAEDKKVEWDLTPIFETQLSDSQLNLKFQVAKEAPQDFEAWYNGQPIKSGDIIDIKAGKPAILQIQFNHNAKTGKRYFDLLPVGQISLDLINGQPAEDYAGTSLRTEYKTGWNPLATFLFWLVIVVLGLLILWFLALKQMVYPKIKVARLNMTGPGSYYFDRRIKGYRKIIFTTKKKKQNWLSRLFTGKIMYVRADHFNPGITVVPSGQNRKIKFQKEDKTNKAWNVYPSSILGIDVKGSIKHPDNDNKADIYIS